MIRFLLQLGGVRQGDVIVGIGGTDARWLSHEEVVALVKVAGDSLHIRLVTPMDAKVCFNELDYDLIMLY